MENDFTILKTGILKVSYDENNCCDAYVSFINDSSLVLTDVIPLKGRSPAWEDLKCEVHHDTMALTKNLAIRMSPDWKPGKYAQVRIKPYVTEYWRKSLEKIERDNLYGIKQIKSAFEILFQYEELGEGSLRMYCELPNGTPEIIIPAGDWEYKTKNYILASDKKTLN